MPRKKKNTTALVPSSVAMPVERKMAGHHVVVDAVYFSRDIHPSTNGPWKDEADKIAWTDPVYGYGCIIRRNETRGHLGGYVGIGPNHPLFGWEEYALRAAGLKVHGGIGYARGCEDWEGEARSICHVPRGGVRPAVHEKTHEVILDHRGEDDLWWIGFECDKPYDIVPDPTRVDKTEGYDGALDREYRDEGYVFEQCTSLAAQLAAIELGRDPADAVLAFSFVGRMDPVEQVRQ